MLMIPLNPDITTPMYEQIYEYIKKEIVSGTLERDTKLPSSRTFAEQLAISRSTINSAYEQLLSEGYIYSKEKSGFFVSDIKSMGTLSQKTYKDTSRFQQEFKEAQNTIPVKHKKHYTFSPFAIDTESFPYSTWRKLMNNAITDMNADALSLGDARGDLAFRKAIAGYLSQARGVHCSPEQIIVGAGTDYLLMLLCGLFRKGQIIAMENPTYIRAYHVFHGLERRVVPVPVTETGMDISYLKETDASIAYVTPSHQYPLGAIMPVNKRHELLSWAEAAPDRYIIEDDHDSEYRYKGIPIPSLQSMDSYGKVIYLGTFSRAIAPAIRVSYMVLPVELMTEFQTNFTHYSSTVSRVDQKVLTNFINGGYLERHLNKMRKNYHQKHDSMLKSLRCFKHDISVSGENAGLHLVITFKNGMTEDEIRQRTEDAGIYLYSLKEHEITSSTIKEPTYLFGFAGLSEKEIAETISKLYRVLN